MTPDGDDDSGYTSNFGACMIKGMILLIFAVTRVLGVITVSPYECTVGQRRLIALRCYLLLVSLKSLAFTFKF